MTFLQNLQILGDLATLLIQLQEILIHKFQIDHL